MATAAPPRPALTTHEVKQRLRTYYAPPAYALLWEVGDATGMRHTRWADALVMSLWPSRGLTLTGIEIKVSRTDWRKELENPAKAEAICRYCDAWYVVVGDSGIVHDGELPPAWGLIVPHGDGLKVKVAAPPLTPQSVDRTFLAALFRRAAEQSVDAQLVEQARKDGHRAGIEEGKREVRRTDAAHELLYKELHAKVQAFEKASGVSIAQGWQGGERIGDAVRQVLNRQHEYIPARLKQLRESAAGILSAIDKELAAVGGPR